MSLLSISPRVFRQFISLFLIYTLAVPQVIIAAQRPMYERQAVSNISATPSIKEKSAASNASSMVPVVTPLATPTPTPKLILRPLETPTPTPTPAPATTLVG